MAIADRTVMSPAPVYTTYAEPTIMWRLRRADGCGAHALIIPHGNAATAMWFAEGKPEESRDFTNWHDAIYWLDCELAKLLLVGWQVENLQG